MANPDYNKKEFAVSEDITKDQFILGEFRTATKIVDGKETDLQVVVPSETIYYATDDKFVPVNSAAFQVHRWLDRIPLDPSNPGTEIMVGEWSIMDKATVQRGDLMNRRVNVEVPWWDPKLQTFTLISSARKQPGQFRAPPKIPVDFNTDAILVDFEGGGGKRPYPVGKFQVSDEAPAELLILGPDGKLVVHRSRLDAEDPDRMNRYDTWQNRIALLKAGANQVPGTTPGGGTGSLFGKPPGTP